MSFHYGAMNLMSELLGLDEDHQVLFTSGASTQFAMLPMNFIPPGGSADYVDTGTWVHQGDQRSQDRRRRAGRGDE